MADFKTWDEYKSEHVSAEELCGKTVTGTIARIRRGVEVGHGSDKKTKAVIYLQGSDRGIVMCTTNMLRVASALGTRDPDQWIGKKVTIYPTATKDTGARVKCCIRVRPAQGYYYPSWDVEYPIADEGKHIKDSRKVTPGPQQQAAPKQEEAKP